MRENKKNKLLLFIFIGLFIIGNTFISCETEKNFTNEMGKNNLVLKRCSLKDSKLQSNKKLIQAFEKFKGLQTNMLLNTSVNGKLIYDENSGLFYDDEKGFYVSKDGKESYNFPVYQIYSDEKIENISFSKNANDEYDIYLVKYDYSKEDLKKYSKEVLGEKEILYFPLIKDGIVYSERVMLCVDIETVSYIADGTSVTIDGTDYDVYCPIVTFTTFCETGGEVGPSFGSGAGVGGGSDSGSGGDSGSGTGGGGPVDGTNPSTTNPPSSSTNVIEVPKEDSILTALVVDDENTTPKKFPCITPEKLLEIFPGSSLQSRIKLSVYIQTNASLFGIDNNIKLSHFLAQIKVESTGLTTTVEGLNYTTIERLRNNFWDFNLSNPNSVDPTPYLNNKEGLANFVYCCNKNGTGNGDVASGDGWKYRGRGYIQLTGKYNYNQYHDYLISIGKGNLYQSQDDLVNDPNRILSAMWFFKTKVLDKINIDENTSADKVTKRINKNTDKDSYTKRRIFFENIKSKINC